jgi:4-amino-4-deoxy-L-arabinose transferase-like glycosyltransferase
MRYRKQPTLRAAAVLGALVGWAAMTRPEQLLLGLIVMVPLVVQTSTGTRDRVLRLGAAAGTCLVLVLPWVVFNANRFERPVYLSANLDYTISTANCQETWYGSRIGFWSSECPRRDLEAVGLTIESGDQSQRGIVLRDAGLAYLRSNLGRLPVVVTARVLRMVNLWDPLEQIRLDNEIEGREYWTAAAAVVGFFVTAGFAMAGAIQLRRRHRLRIELVGPGVIVLISAALFMGNTRYRSPAEGVLCVLAAVGLDVVLERRRQARVMGTASRPVAGDLQSVADRDA